MSGNYASNYDTVRITSKRFDRSPWLASYITPDTVLGVYAGRFFTMTLGEDPVDAYWQLRRGVVLFDVPERPIEIEGPDALAFMNRLFCRDVSRLRIGRATYAIACNHDGGIVMDGVLMRLDEQRYWYVLADGEFMTWLEAHRVDYAVQVRDPRSWVLQVQGPHALDVLNLMIDEPLANPFSYFSVHQCTVANEPFMISRTGWTGELGFELYSMNPQVDGASVFNHLMQAGATFDLRFSALESMGMRRIEAGIMDNGTDMDLSMTPFAAGLGQFVELEKTDHIGAQALREADQRCAFYGVTAAHDVPVERYVAMRDGQVVGRLTAASGSPTLQQTIGYVRFDEPGEWVGKAISLQASDGGIYQGQVVSLPFYDEKKLIPRGLAAEDTS